MILSLQGCMAVGKTTALRWAETHAARFCVSYEDDMEVLRTVRERGLRQHVFEEYVEIQRLWIRGAICRAEPFRERNVLMDFGPEETLFFTLHYPASIGCPDWPVAQVLKAELDELSEWMPRRILFLDASPEILCMRRATDRTRPRNSFEHHLKNLMPLKRAWLLGRPDVDVLDTERLTCRQTGERVLEWTESWIGS